jgi:hypothetical protein
MREGLRIVSDQPIFRALKTTANVHVENGEQHDAQLLFQFCSI